MGRAAAGVEIGARNDRLLVQRLLMHRLAVDGDHIGGLAGAFRFVHRLCHIGNTQPIAGIIRSRGINGRKSINTYEMRIYTLKSAEAAAAYREIWIKHIESLKAFGIVTHGVFAVASDPAKVVALVNYPEGVDPKAATDRYMASEMFKSDMAGFDFAWFSSVEATLLRGPPTTESSSAPRRQEIISVLPFLTKYEGASKVSGTYGGKPVKGFGYVELVGA